MKVGLRVSGKGRRVYIETTIGSYNNDHKRANDDMNLPLPVKGRLGLGDLNVTLKDSSC